MGYAVSKNIQYLALVEATDLESNSIRLRNITTREEVRVDIDALLDFFKNKAS